jgi:hypothetical protein
MNTGANPTIVGYNATSNLHKILSSIFENALCSLLHTTYAGVVVVNPKVIKFAPGKTAIQ